MLCSVCCCASFALLEFSGFVFINFQVAIIFDVHPDLLDEFPHLQNPFQPLNERGQMHMDKVIFCAFIFPTPNPPFVIFNGF
jgi:hypothetical protein